MKTYVFSEKDGKETILYESKSNYEKGEKECIEWVHKNCVEHKDHWELNGEWVGLTN